MRRLCQAVIATLISVSVLAAAGCDGSGEPSETASSRTPEVTTIAGPTAPGGGTIRVVETGFTISADAVRRLTLAVLVENTSKIPGTGTVRVRFIGADGSTVRYWQKETLTLRLGRVHPGGRAAVAEDEPGTAFNTPLAVTRVEVQVEDLRWWQGLALGKGTIADVTIAKDAAGTWTATFTATYTPPENTPGDRVPLAVILRNDKGKIVGGYRLSQEPIMPGRAVRQIELGDDPSGGWIPLDPVRTEFLMEF